MAVPIAGEGIWFYKKLYYAPNPAGMVFIYKGTFIPSYKTCQPLVEAPLNAPGASILWQLVED